jgi:tRNA nucleotidyltransferase (CCA-adding enzyme)
MDVLKEVLLGIKPNAEQEKEVITKINAFLKKLNAGLKHAKAELYGSGAKGTWLKGGFDADIFVKYDYKKFADKSDKISDELRKHLSKKRLKFGVMHGSRDYYRIKEESFVYEVIPILDIKKADEAKNITDISPLHAKWVKANVNKKLVDDIRLAKAFLRANNLYGAESYIRGFSGYVTEILVIYYRGFLNFLKAAVKWKDKGVIDIRKYHKDVFLSLNNSKLESPIIVVDPVDKTRNAAAALGYEKAEKLKQAAKRFLNKPDKKFFEKEEMTEDKLKEKSKGKKLVIIEAKTGSGKEDVVGARIVKSYEFILKKLGEKDFDVIDSGWEWDKKKKAMIWLITDSKELEKMREHEGPFLDRKQHVRAFREKYRKVYEKGGRLYAMVERGHTKPEEYIKELMKDSWFEDKIKVERVKAIY